MHEAMLSQAALPQTPRIFRVKLLPYTLGHELHLHRRQSPFVTMKWDEIGRLTRGEKLASTMQAVEVCSRDFRSNCTPPRFWGLWRRMAEWCDLDLATRELWNYLQAAGVAFDAELPDIEGYKSRFIGAPEVLRMYRFVCDRVPEREIAFYSTARPITAWDFPYALATLMKQSDAEDAGQLSIYSIKDRAHDEYVARMEAKAAEKAG
jgi:hypothetical protein